MYWAKLQTRAVRIGFGKTILNVKIEFESYGYGKCNPPPVCPILMTVESRLKNLFRTEWELLWLRKHYICAYICIYLFVCFVISLAYFFFYFSFSLLLRLSLFLPPSPSLSVVRNLSVCVCMRMCLCSCKHFSFFFFFFFCSLLYSFWSFII